MGKALSGSLKENGPTAAMQSVKISLRWTRDVTRASLRWALLRAMVSVMLNDVPEPRRSHWIARIRAIDTHPGSLYHGHKVNNPNNDLTSSSSAVGENPDSKGGA